MATTTNLDVLKINYLTQAQYDAALTNNQINENELYLTPSTNSDIIDLIYPVGSIYMSVNSASPATLFGGTWVQIKDTFLLAAGDTYAGGATGGEATHKLTAAESGVPAHGHGFTQPSVTGGSHYHALSGSKTAGLSTGDYLRVGYGSDTGKNTATDGSHSHTVSGGAVQQNTAAGAANAHNNMPPYLTVYMWKRTA